MLDHEELWMLEDMSTEEPPELLMTMPEIKQYLGADPADEVGLQSMLDRPGVLSKAWRHHAFKKTGPSRPFRAR